MPITSTVDVDKKLIHTICAGVICRNDFDYYMHEFLAKNNITGCNELFDTREGDWSKITYTDLVAIALASLEVENIDTTTKFAWVVNRDEVSTMTDFYKESKIFHDKKSRTLCSFNDYNEAMKWLGV